ncbi:cytochrome b N-terminal domain-containing protein [Thermodesulfobacteriota bacterium]
MEPQYRPFSEAYGFFRRIWQSIFPEPLLPRKETERKRYLIQNLIFHFRPPTVSEKTLRFSLTWGLGGMATVLVILQFATGLLLKFAYEPTPVSAYASILSLQADMPFGRLIRNLHHWCANLLVLIVFLHMLRVFFTGAFHRPRQFNWLIGLTMFGIVLMANFTGYLLPYDQLAYWAVTVSTGMLAYIPGIGEWLQEMIRSGQDIGPAALRLFFAIHTAVIPIVLATLMAFHFWRVRKAGGLVIPRAPEEEIEEKPFRVPTLPDLLLRESVVALVLIAAVTMGAVFLNAPLADPANPGLSPNPTKAPWYFAGLQELLLHLHPMFSVFVIPFLAGMALVCIPYLNYPVTTEGIWFASRRGRKLTLVAALAALIITPALVITDDVIIKPTLWFSGFTPAIRGGLIPTVVLLAAISGFFLIVKKGWRASKNEAVQAVFMLLVTAFVVLTILGVLFRGPEMKLILPL